MHSKLYLNSTEPAICNQILGLFLTSVAAEATSLNLDSPVFHRPEFKSSRKNVIIISEY